MIGASCIFSSSGRSMASAPRLQPSAGDWFPYHVKVMPGRCQTGASRAIPSLGHRLGCGKWDQKRKSQKKPFPSCEPFSQRSTAVGRTSVCHPIERDELTPTSGWLSRLAAARSRKPARQAAIAVLAVHRVFILRRCVQMAFDTRRQNMTFWHRRCYGEVAKSRAPKPGVGGLGPERGIMQRDPGHFGITPLRLDRSLFGGQTCRPANDMPWGSRRAEVVFTRGRGALSRTAFASRTGRQRAPEE
jgi:hypothetical protein